MLGDRSHVSRDPCSLDDASRRTSTYSRASTSRTTTRLRRRAPTASGDLAARPSAGALRPRRAVFGRTPALDRGRQRETPAASLGIAFQRARRHGARGAPNGEAPLRPTRARTSARAGTTSWLNRRRHARLAPRAPRDRRRRLPRSRGERDVADKPSVELHGDSRRLPGGSPAARSVTHLRRVRGMNVGTQVFGTTRAALEHGVELAGGSAAAAARRAIARELMPSFRSASSRPSSTRLLRRAKAPGPVRACRCAPARLRGLLERRPTSHEGWRFAGLHGLVTIVPAPHAARLCTSSTSAVVLSHLHEHALQSAGSTNARGGFTSAQSPHARVHRHVVRLAVLEVYASSSPARPPRVVRVLPAAARRRERRGSRSARESGRGGIGRLRREIRRARHPRRRATRGPAGSAGAAARDVGERCGDIYPAGERTGALCTVGVRHVARTTEFVSYA